MLLILRLVKRFASLGLIMLAIAVVAATTMVAVGPELATIATVTENTAAELELDDLELRSSMYSSDGDFLTFLVYEKNRQSVSLDDIPQPVIDAVLAMEDADFYNHDGVNYRAVFRALIENINAGGIAQGGSTITQQLVKNAFLTSSQDLDRKSTEAFYALRLERQFTKDEILERYLNTIYFGAGAYGVQAAAETYWGYEDVSEMSWSEAAMLAGIIRNPRDYDPTRNAKVARRRRATVADVLVNRGLVTEAEGEEIKRAPLPAERQEPFDIKPTDYFVEEALVELLNNEEIPIGTEYEERFETVYFGGLQVFTTFDLEAQEMAKAARAAELPEDERGFTVAVAAVDTHTGAVRAMVGGPDFQLEAFNLTTDGLGRQPGSSMKTFVLAALFEAGYTPRDTVRGDAPCTFPNPGGFPNPYKAKGGRGGVQSLAAVTRSSNNCAFVRLGQVVGNDKVIDVAQRLGISTLQEEDAVLSLPLGSKEVHPLEMASAYAAMGNDGLYNAPWYIERIEDRSGNIIYEHRADSRRALSIQSARMITEVLASNVRSGTGKRARLDNGHEAAGKTGTAQNNEDAWFVGYTDYLTTAVWMGHPDEKVRMRNVGPFASIFGGSVPALVWGHFNNAYHAELEPSPFEDPDPYSGGRYLKVDSEQDFCNSADRGLPVTETTVIVDDAGNKCFEHVTTTTIPVDADGNPLPTIDGGGVAPTTPTTVPGPVTTPVPTTAPAITPAPTTAGG